MFYVWFVVWHFLYIASISWFVYLISHPVSDGQSPIIAGIWMVWCSVVVARYVILDEIRRLKP